MKSCCTHLIVDTVMIPIRVFSTSCVLKAFRAKLCSTPWHLPAVAVLLSQTVSHRRLCGEAVSRTGSAQSVLLQRLSDRAADSLFNSCQRQRSGDITCLGDGIVCSARGEEGWAGAICVCREVHSSVSSAALRCLARRKGRCGPASSSTVGT